jgi:membrane protein required for colicin V production
MAVVDIVVIAVIVVAALAGLMTGFVRILGNLGGWVVASLVTLYGFSYARPIAREWIGNSLLADAAAGAALFIVSLIVVSFITHTLVDKVQSSNFSALDRSLGLVAGIALGVVLLCGAFLVVEQVWKLEPDKKSRPKWIQASRTVPVVEWGANSLWKAVPEEWQHLRRKENRQKTDKERDAEAKKAFEKLIQPEPKAPAQEEKSGYNERERQGLDRLIQTHK